MTETKRQSIAAKVRALLAKTVENGATEDEAIAAMEKAHELMARYQLSLTDAELEEEGTSRFTTAAHDVASHQVNRKLRTKIFLANAVSRYCDCKTWRSDGVEEKINFFGLRSDAEFASWLIDSLTLFVELETDRHLAKSGVRGADARWRARVSFSLGCVTRIAERLDELVAAREVKDGKTATGTSLIVVKNALVERDFKSLGLQLRKGSSRGRSVNSAHYSAGQAAGNRATFGKPVNGGAGTRLLK